MSKKDGKQEGPLSSEALKRDEWRGAVLLSDEDAPGHTLPESESDAAAGEGAGKTRGGLAGTIMPPD